MGGGWGREPHKKNTKKTNNTGINFSIVEHISELYGSMFNLFRSPQLNYRNQTHTNSKIAVYEMSRCFTLSAIAPIVGPRGEIGQIGEFLKHQ